MQAKQCYIQAKDQDETGNWEKLTLLKTSVSSSSQIENPGLFMCMRFAIVQMFDVAIGPIVS